MIGKHRDGGYAEFITVPGRNAFLLPDEISFEHGAIMMCSSATALHALNKARLKPGESVAIFGFGGLGFSALQLARAFDCGQIYVVEINPAKLATAATLGGVPIDATAGDPVQQILDATRRKRRRRYDRISRLCRDDATSRPMSGHSGPRRDGRLKPRIHVDASLPRAY